MDTAFICWFIIAIASLILLCTGCYLLISEKNKKAIDYLLIHLCCVELVALVWDGTKTIGLFFLEVKPEVKSTVLEIYKVGSVSLVVGQLMSIIFLTVDRVLAVKLTFRYRVVVTKRKILILFVFCWIFCFLHGLITYFFLISVYNLVLNIWGIITFIVIFFGYGYIIIVVHMTNRELAVNNQVSQRRNVKLIVPAGIVITFVLLVVIPDWILEIGVPYSPWFLCSFHANYLCDSLIYILGSGRIKQRFYRWFRRPPLVNHGEASYVTSTV